MKALLKFFGSWSAKTWIVVIIGVMVVGTAGRVWGNYKELVHKYENSLLVIDRMEAEQDTTRVVLRNLEDSITVYQRRVIQQKQVSDSLDALLRTERALKANLTLQVDSMALELSSSVTEAADTLKMDFRKDTTFYSVNVGVVVPPPDTLTRKREATAKIRVSLSPIGLGVRIGCQPNSEETLNKALVNILVPEWATIRVDLIEQEPRVCNPDLSVLDTRSFYERPWFVAGATTGIIAILSLIF